MIQLDRLEQSLAVIDRLITLCTRLQQSASLHKYYVSKTIVQLAMGDVVAADRAVAAHQITPAGKVEPSHQIFNVEGGDTYRHAFAMNRISTKQASWFGSDNSS